jgi:uncharacterized membrane protein YadS
MIAAAATTSIVHNTGALDVAVLVVVVVITTAMVMMPQRKRCGPRATTQFCIHRGSTCNLAAQVLHMMMRLRLI